MAAAGALIFTFSLVVAVCSVGGMPQAFVHIGPPKTASSHIQASLHQYRVKLAASNLYWPPHAQTSKSNVHFALAMNASDFGEDYNATEIPSMTMFLNESRLLNRNIVLSTEYFALFSSKAIRTLQSYLEGYNVTVVMAYRELMSQLISSHFELNRLEHDIDFSFSFAVEMFKTMDDLPRHLRPTEVLDSFATVFGADHVRVVDLAGIVAAKKDVAYVVACEVMGVLCDSPKLFSLKTNPNPSFSLIPAQVFSLYKNFVTIHRCRFAGSSYKEYQYLMARFNETVKTHAGPPLLQSNLTMLRPYVLQVDTAFREKYGPAMLYGDRAANEKSIISAHVRELDVERFIADPWWDEWIRAEVHHARATGRLRNCTMHTKSLHDISSA